MKSIIFSFFLLSAAASTTLISPADKPLRIGSTETIREVNSGLPFMARIDTGAQSCSIHCEAMTIDNPAEDPRKNIGKNIRFLIKNKRGQSKWVSATIADYVTVRTSELSSGRYKVRLSLFCRNIRKEVLVTLNDRQHMKYPMLIGRNFLRDDFMVAVD
jgi:hypothetical protein